MRCFALAGVLAGNVACARGQAPSTRDVPTLRVETRIVLLDVNVTDKSGHSITDLRREDFTIAEDKAVEAIQSFEPPQEHALPATDLGMLGNSGVKNYGESPLSVFVLDELSTRLEDMSYARYSLKKYLDRQPARLAQPATLMVVGNRSLIRLVDWTRDRDAILKELIKRRPDVPVRLNAGIDAIGSAERLSDSLAALQQIAQANAGERGKKNVIWLGQGFPALNTDNLDPVATGLIANSLHATARLLLDARVTVYTVDPKGLSAYGAGAVNDPDEAPATGLVDPSAMMFEGLTTQTGGRAFKLRNDVDIAIDTSVAEGASYYAMSYSPSNQSYDGKFRQIRVTVNRPGLIVRTRDGYFGDADTKASPQMIAFELTKASQSPLPFTGLILSASDFKRRSPVVPAIFLLHVDPRGLSWKNLQNGDKQVEFTVAVALTNDSGKVLGYKVKEVATNAKAAHAKQIMSAPLIYSVPVDVPPGATHLRVVVRDASNGRIGTADFDKQVLQSILYSKKR